MAKVVAPLQSFSASGKIGKSLVFFSHLGRNVVRGLVTPANPQTTLQGDTRLLLGGLGRAAKAMVNGSLAYEDLKTVVPAGQTWNSTFVRQSIDYFGSGQTGVAALDSAFDGHTEDAQFTASAAGLGLTDMTISYAGTIKTIEAGAQLYALAHYIMAVKGSNPDLFDRTPYTTALASWSSANVAAFASDISTIV